MISRIIFLLLIILFPWVLWAGQYTVTHVYDGDTIGVGGRGIELKVTLAGIDAPDAAKGNTDTGQPYNQQAKRYLADLVLNKSVSVDRYGLGPDNGMIGVVYVGTKNINLEMLKAGLAKVYHGLLPKGFNLEPYRQAEKKAKEGGKGIWSPDNKYTSPPDWKIRDKRR